VNAFWSFFGGGARLEHGRGVLGNAWNAVDLDEVDHSGCWFVGCLVQFVAGEALPVVDVDDHGGCGFNALAVALEHGDEGYMVEVEEWQAMAQGGVLEVFIIVKI